MPPAPPHPLTTALALRPRGELVAFVGGGGKTTLLLALGRELAAAGRRVVATTTTRMAVAELLRAPAYCLAADLDGLDHKLQTHRFCLVAGDLGPDKARGVPLDLPAALLARPTVDHVLVEADGAKRLPVKAPAAHEPAVPPQTTLLVPVVGIDALAAPLRDVAHRPRRLAALLNMSLHEKLTPQHLARLLASPHGALRNAPPHARIIPFINKVETPAQLAQAQEVARLLFAGVGPPVEPLDPRIRRLLIGAAQTATPIRHVHER